MASRRLIIWLSRRIGVVALPQFDYSDIRIAAGSRQIDRIVDRSIIVLGGVGWPRLVFEL